ncbi:MAG: metallophosphoesterase [Halolamina sp.]
MLVVCSDTHGRNGPGLDGRTAEAVADAELVIHAGDFTTAAVLDAFRERADVRAVHGNRDDAAVRDRLPSALTVEYAGVRFAVTHTRRGGPTALSLFGRERDADCVVFGHSHAPTVGEADGLTLLNPGSHADPRGNRAAHAELEPTADGLRGRLVAVSGEVFDRFEIGGQRAGRNDGN